MTTSDEALVIPLPVPESAGSQAGGPAAAAPGSAATLPPRSAWERRVAAGLAEVRRRLTGEYEVDEFGFDPDLTDHVLAPTFRPLYRRWFRTEVTGVRHIPEV